MKKSFRQRRHEVQEARHRAGGLAHDGDVGGVAAERCDVLLNPFKSQDLIVHSLKLFKVNFHENVFVFYF
jgi:hypothetical protein